MKKAGDEQPTAEDDQDHNYACSSSGAVDAGADPPSQDQGMEKVRRAAAM